MTRSICVGVALVVVSLPLATLRAGEEEEPAAATRPAIPDARWVAKEVAAALEELPLRVEGMDVTERAARVRVSVEEQATFDEVRARLEGNAYLKERARDPERVVGLGAVQHRDGRWQRDFELRFAQGNGAPAPERAAAHIAQETMYAAATAAGLRPVYASRERVTRDEAGGYERVSQRFEYEALDGNRTRLTLDRLDALLERIAANPSYRVTEITWRRAEANEDLPDPGDAIRKPQVEVSAWRPTP